MSNRNINAAETLRAMADTFEERNAKYGGNWEVVGNVMTALFPNGVTLSTADDFIRFHLFDWAIGKITRFTNTGMLDMDSIHDAAVYMAMIESFMASFDPEEGFKSNPKTMVMGVES